MSTWSTTKKLTIATVISSVILLALLCSSTIYVMRLPKTIGDQETVVLGTSRFVPGSEAAIRVAVRDYRDASPVEKATIKVSLAPQGGGQAVVLYEGATDALGTADVRFRVPEDVAPNQTLIVETRSGLGQDRVERAVTVRRDYKVLLTTDKPLYQPGQLILVRALALGSFDLKPAAGQSVEFVISDPKGNKVFRQTVTASDYGIASTEFQLADQVNTGPYKIVATLGNTSSEKTVTVKYYVLPKFKVEASTDKSFYLPGETVSGRVSANYFFGKPVSAGQVQINGYVFDVQMEQVLSVQGATDDEGHYDFSFQLPDYFVTSLESGVASFIVEVAVTDQAAHTERINLDVPVAQQSIIVDAVPESGQLRPGVENVVYVLTAYPDGAPAQCQVSILINGQEHRLETGQYGLAEWRFTPDQGYVEVQATARDALGHTATQTLSFEGYWGEQVLLRPERAAYRVGETMHLDVFTSQPVGTVYLDIVREGQTISTRALEIAGGHAATDVDLTADLYGTLELHTYKILSWGEIVRDTRLVLVDAPTDLTVAVTPDKDTYLPGGGPDEELAHVRFTVTDAAGAGTRAALGIAVVDESVFALQEQDPGFLKLYFLLEREILQPRYQIKQFTLPAAVFYPSPDQDVRQAQDISAKAALAAAAPSTGLGLQANSHSEKEQQAKARQQQGFHNLTRVLTPLMLLLPLTLLVVSVVAIARERTLPLALIVTLLLVFGCVATFVALPAPPWYDHPSLLDKLGYYLGELLSNGEVATLCVVGGVLLAGLVALIALAVWAWRRSDAATGINLVLFILYLLLFPMFLIAVIASGIEPNTRWTVAVLVSYLLVPLTFFLRAVGHGLRRQVVPLIAGLVMVGFALFSGIVPLVLAGSTAGAVFSGQAYALRGAPVPAAMMIEKVMATPVPEAPPADAGATSQGEAPRLRQFFPETMFWAPEVLTDASGQVTVDVPIADSITTWRLSAVASSQDGELGSVTTGLRVFQDFFVDIDLPVSLTQDDEVSMPVAVHNYLAEGQTVRLTLEQEDWFQLLDEPTKELYIAGNDVEVVYFRIKVTATSGRYRPRVLAMGEKMSDYTTSTHDVIIFPNGKRFEQTVSDRLSGEVTQVIPIPAETINGTARITVKIYPGILSQVVEGLEKILRLPHG